MSITVYTNKKPIYMYYAVYSDYIDIQSFISYVFILQLVSNLSNSLPNLAQTSVDELIDQVCYSMHYSVIQLYRCCVVYPLP